MFSASALAIVRSSSTCPAMTGQVESPLERVARGEPRAVEACVREYGPMVLNLARRLLRLESDVEDAVQDVFIALWKAADRFDPSRASDRGFVAMIARRRLIDRIRKQDRRPDTVSLPQGMEWSTDEHRKTEAKTEAGPVLGALETLPDDRRQYVVLSVVDGFSHSEIAEKLGVPLGTVKSGIRRGLLAMRAHLSGQAGWEVVS